MGVLEHHVRILVRLLGGHGDSGSSGGRGQRGKQARDDAACQSRLTEGRRWLPTIAVSACFAGEIGAGEKSSKKKNRNLSNQLTCRVHM